jgi:hypothetical protein
LVSIKSQLSFSTDHSAAITAVDSVSAGRGWCNVIPGVTEDADDLKMNGFGLWVSKGVCVATLVTSPPRKSAPQPSSLGVLHTRGRLGRERLAALLADAPFKVRQDHSQRGLLLDVPVDTSTTVIVNAMCSLTTQLCDYDVTGSWRLDLFVRD